MRVSYKLLCCCRSQRFFFKKYKMNMFYLLFLFHVWNVWTSPLSRLVLASNYSNSKDLDTHGVNFHERKINRNTESEIGDSIEEAELVNSDGQNIKTDDWRDLVDDLKDFDFGKDKDDLLESYDPITDTIRLDGGYYLHKTGTGNGRKESGYDDDQIEADQFMNRNSTEHNNSDITLSSFFISNFEDGLGNNNYNNIYGIVCPEKCACEGTKMDCAGQNLTSVPEGISPLTTWLDLSMNSLQRLPEDTFLHMVSLKELRCVGNNLTDLPDRLFIGNKFLQLLNFQGNFFTEVPGRAFQNLNHLLELHLDANLISAIPKDAFGGLTNLKQLWLDDNRLDEIPVSAFKELTGLQALTLIKNQIDHIPDYAFMNNTRLVQLRLANNQIKEVADKAFFGLTKLKYLQLQNNKISTMPTAFSYLTSLVELNLEENRLTEIPARSFQDKEKLTTLILGYNPIVLVSDEAFTNLPSLQELKLSEIHDMTNFPDLTGTMNLSVLQLDRANIKSIPKDVCLHLKRLKTFDVHSNKIGTIPEMSQCRYLTILNMANNELTSIDGQLFNGMDHLKDMTLTINYIHTISEDAFVGLGALEYLNLAENQISEIHPLAFLPLKSLKDLNLGYNRIHHLPTAGLVNLEKLKVFHNPDLREFPRKDEFPKVNNFVLSYAYHCCDYMLSRPEQMYLDTVREHVVWMDAGAPGQMAMWEKYENDSRIWESLIENATIENELWESFARNDYDLSNYRLGPAAATYLEDYQSQAYDHNYVIAKAAISCKPKPGPFMPCDDLFGWWSLRCGVWFVFMLALLGNGAVFFVSMTSKSKMDVPRFLICNLALADFLMGIYLGILAIMDASTLGQFKKYAIQWQMSAGCLAAGTLCVLSSELSVFTLTVITLERFYAITHAMQLSKRLSLKHAGVIMLCGWIWSFGLAILPLFGISDYRRFAVCLPFEIESVLSKTYVCFIMVFNGISFFIILSCYLIMYISIRDSQAWNSNDTRVAKRMALLVFTDFLCWAPIAFLSLAAAFGKNLIHLNEAKVLTIFILPLNSCANPFLYAFFTKQFKKDCVLLCRRLEDSSIARHFSQVSHRNVSVSWKYQRRPSAHHSLMGEIKSNNSQNNSSSSNSYGLVNYNSECFHRVSSRTNMVTGNDTYRSDKRVVHITRGSGATSSISGGASCSRTSHKHTHKYKPCPNGEPVEDNDNIGYIKIAYADGSTDEDVQVILHQDFYSQSGTETNGCTVESYLNDEDDNCFFFLAQPSSDELIKDNHNCTRKDSFNCPSIVIHEAGSFDADEDCIWMKGSLVNFDSELQHVQQQDKCFSNYECPGTQNCENGVKYHQDNMKIAKKKQNNHDSTESTNYMDSICTNGKQGHGSMALNDGSTDFKEQDKKTQTDNKEQELCEQGNKESLLTDTCEETNDGSCHQCNKSGSIHQCICNSSFIKLKEHNMPGCGLKDTDVEFSYNHSVNSCMPEQSKEGVEHKKKKRMKYDISKSLEIPATDPDVTSMANKNSVKMLHEHTNTPQNGVTNSSSLCSDHHAGKISDLGSFPAVSSKNKTEQRRKKSKNSKRHHHSSRKHSHKVSNQVNLMALASFDAACNKVANSDGTHHSLNQNTDSLVPASANNVFIPELHNQTDVDKSVHLRYFQQFIENYGIMHKSNSLCELTQAQLDWTQSLHLSKVKRNSLTSRQEGCTLLYSEPNECVPPWFSHNSSCQNYVPFSNLCDDKPDHELSTLTLVKCLNETPNGILIDSEREDSML